MALCMMVMVQYLYWFWYWYCWYPGRTHKYRDWFWYSVYTDVYRGPIYKVPGTWYHGTEMARAALALQIGPFATTVIW